MEWLYRALTLDSRALVLTGAEAALKSEHQTLGQPQSHLQIELRGNAEAQDRLRELLWRLAGEPVTFSLPAMPSTGEKVARLQRTLVALATAASRLPDSPPLLNASNRQVTEVLRAPDGTLRVLTAVKS